MLRFLPAAFLLIVGAFGFSQVKVSDPVGTPQEAPTGFTGVTNGLIDQAEFDANVGQFSEEAIPKKNDEQEGGLGPTFNNVSCKSCHNAPVVGGSSQIAELRIGHMDGSTFVFPPGGTLMRQRATDPAAQQRVTDDYEIRTRRMSTNLLGLGYIEFLDDAAIIVYRDSQPADMRGFANMVDVTTGIGPSNALRLPQVTRTIFDQNTGIRRQLGGLRGLTTDKLVGRFGWKAQHASIVDFSADALLNEIGRTSIIQPDEAKAIDGRDLSPFDLQAEPEDETAPDAPFGKDVKAYTRFIRATKAPGRDYTLAATAETKAGESLFNTLGCAVCHRPTWATSPAGTLLKGRQAVPDALGNKIIHPYTDFLLHRLGSGDGIVQNGPPTTIDMIKTPALWSLRNRPEMMHDGLSYTYTDVIERHGGQAATVRDNFRALNPTAKKSLFSFLRSL